IYIIYSLLLPDVYHFLPEKNRTSQFFKFSSIHFRHFFVIYNTGLWYIQRSYTSTIRFQFLQFVETDLSYPIQAVLFAPFKKVIEKRNLFFSCGYHHFSRSEEHTSELQSRENLVC